MYYTQNAKLLQVGEEKIIVGIDVGSEKHYARAFDWRGVEYSKKPYVQRSPMCSRTTQKDSQAFLNGYQQS